MVVLQPNVAMDFDQAQKVEPEKGFRCLKLQFQPTSNRNIKVWPRPEDFNLNFG